MYKLNGIRTGIIMLVALLGIMGSAWAQDDGGLELSIGESGDNWYNGISSRFSLDMYMFDAEYDSSSPLPLGAGESAQGSGSRDGTLYGATLTIGKVYSDLQLALDITYRTGSMDGEVDYSGSYRGTLDVDTDRSEVEFKLNFVPVGVKIGPIYPVAFIGLLHSESDTDETGTLIHVPTNTPFAYSRSIESSMDVGMLGGGGRYEYRMEKLSLGVRGEGAFLFGTRSTNVDRGEALEDGSVYGYNVKLTGYVDVPFTIGETACGTFAEIGALYQDWIGGDTDENDTYTGIYARIGFRVLF